MDIRTPPTLQGEFHEEELGQLEITHVVATAARNGVLVECPAYLGRPFKVKRSKQSPNSNCKFSVITSLLLILNLLIIHQINT